MEAKSICQCLPQLLFTFLIEVEGYPEAGGQQLVTFVGQLAPELHL